MSVKNKIEKANQEVVNRITNSEILWVDLKPAIEVIPGMEKNLILHAGPPISWERMSQPQKNSVIGAAIYEELAKTPEEAENLFSKGEIRLEPCHHYQTVGSMCGATSSSMNVFVMRNETYKNEAYCLIYESPDRERLSWGNYSPKILDNIRWVDSVIASGLRAGLQQAGGSFELKTIMARALTMGDDLHSRCFASTALFAAAIMPHILKSDAPENTKYDVACFLRDLEQFFLHLAMAYSKAAADSAKNIDYSSVVTAIARNGVEVGIKVSSLGDEWFVGPAQPIEGVFFAPYGPEDALPDIGDSAITETCGLGAMAHASSPALALAKHGDAGDALRITKQNQVVCVDQNPDFGMPALNGAGAPVGIDIRKVIDSGLLPYVNTAIVHKDEGGLIGSGTTHPPFEAFKKAIVAFSNKVKSLEGKQ